MRSMFVRLQTLYYKGICIHVSFLILWVCDTEEVNCRYQWKRLPVNARLIQDRSHVPA